MIDAATNPLLSLSAPLPFDRIEPGHVRPAFDALIAEARASLARIADPATPRTYEATLGAFERAIEPLALLMRVVSTLDAVATSAELREVYGDARAAYGAFEASLPLDEGLWAAVQAFAATPQARALEGERARHLERTLELFRRNGAALDAAGKARVQAIDTELARLTHTFAKNTLDATNAYELLVTDPARLAGLPEAAKEAARRRAEARGLDGWRFTLQAPSLLPALSHLEDRGLRETLWRAYLTRCTAPPTDNRPLLRQILRLRREKAQVLGHADFADFILGDRMARTGARAQAFLEALEAAARPGQRGEDEALTAFARAESGEADFELAPWDMRFWSERQRRAEHDVDQEALRAYFPVDRVMAGLFVITERLFGVQVTRCGGMPGWHPDVESYELGRDGQALGRFYVDLYPRESKRGGAWMNGLIAGAPAEGRPHVGLFCANLTPPVDGAPALLLHDEVRTIFHEFGHLLHHLLTEVSVPSLAGTNVAWDFVELPSKLMENWCWAREGLSLFARHHETGAPLPDDLLERVLAARDHRAASGLMRHLGFSTTDLVLHRVFDPEDEAADPVAMARANDQRFGAAPLPDDYAMIASFSHLFSSSVGYAAGYYSYLWSEALAADVFARFEAVDVLSPEVGRAYVEAILGRGDSAPPEALFEAFTGRREPSTRALLRSLGIAPDDDAAASDHTSDAAP